MKIGIIGAGNVGGTLGRRLAERGYDVMFGVRTTSDPKLAALLSRSPGAAAGSVKEAGAFADVVMLATPWGATRDAILSAGGLEGKVLLDLTNPIREDFTDLEFGYSTSAGEQVQGWAPGAKVVKIFNTVGYNVMANPDFGGEPATMFYCGDDAGAKSVAAAIASDLEFDPVDAGPLAQARLLEPLAWLWITMALKYGQGTEIAFRLLKR